MPATADEVVDTCCRILAREALRLESRKKPLTAKEVRLIVDVARAAAEVMAIQLDPLGASGRKRLQKLSDEELRAQIEALERQGSAAQ